MKRILEKLGILFQFPLFRITQTHFCIRLRLCTPANFVSLIKNKTIRYKLILVL